MADFFSSGLLTRLGTLWRDLTPGREGERGGRLSPTLPDEDLARVRRQMHACLEGRGGEVSARKRAAALGQAYLGLDGEGKGRFLGLLAREFETNHAAVDAAMAAVAAVPEGDATGRAAAERALAEARAAPRIELLTQFNALPEGVKFLTDLRADLLALGSDDLAVKGLERDLRDLLRSWFDVGFLELRRVTWDSPASLLEKIIAYEAVHTITSWEDLKNRLDTDRRLYAFFHPRMPNEPLIFVQVALIQGMAGSIQALLDQSAPVGDPAEADTAIFYSITSAQKGLAGISFGNFLIKRVVETLSAEFPRLKTFATLSPIRGFGSWLDKSDPDTAEVVAREEWHRDSALTDHLREPVLGLVAHYLAREKRPGRGGRPGTALDSVAHFHLTNGARIERLNWLGDTSAKGLAQSCGVMVNYLYKIEDIEDNHETYSAQGIAALSGGVRALLRD